MAKEHSRSNREARKPKKTAEARAAAAAATAPPVKGAASNAVAIKTKR